MVIDHSALERVLEPHEGKISPEVAAFFLSLGFSPKDHARCEELSEQAQAGTLAPQEQAELDDLLTANDVLMILKAKARTALRRSGSSAA